MADFRQIEALFRGSIDMHIHHDPDTFLPRRLNALEAAQQAQAAGQRAIVLKSHKYPTAPLATIINQVVPDIKVFGAITMDYEIGGLNAHALKTSAQLGAKIVWMPTSAAKNSINKIASRLGIPAEGPGISLIDKKGKLVPEMEEILEIVKKYDMVLANGHISPAETYPLFETAKEMGIRKMVLTHPTEVDVYDEVFTLADQKRLAKMGVYIEYTVCGLLPTAARLSPVPMEFVAVKDLYAKSGKPSELMERCGLTAKDIELAVLRVMKRKR